MEELGMEAVWKIRVENFPAFIIVDDKGNDFFKEFSTDDATVPPEVNSSIYSVLEFFEIVDKNHDQMLDPQELMEGFTNLTIEDSTALIRKYDLGGFGGLNLDEFLTMVMKEEDITLKIGDETAKAKLLAAE
jgi:dTDP-4-dehydrorhamnose 3,5-epimerase-like enzyme